MYCIEQTTTATICFLLFFIPKSGYVQVSFLFLFVRSEVYLRMLLLFFVWVAASLMVEDVIPRIESASAPGREETDDADSAEEEGTSADPAEKRMDTPVVSTGVKRKRKSLPSVIKENMSSSSRSQKGAKAGSAGRQNRPQPGPLTIAGS